jgi:hypothetical protein
MLVILCLLVLLAQFHQHIGATMSVHQYIGGTDVIAPLVLIQTYGQN